MDGEGAQGADNALDASLDTSGLMGDSIDEGVDDDFYVTKSKTAIRAILCNGPTVALRNDSPKGFQK